SVVVRARRVVRNPQPCHSFRNLYDCLTCASHRLNIRSEREKNVLSRAQSRNFFAIEPSIRADTPPEGPNRESGNGRPPVRDGTGGHFFCARSPRHQTSTFQASRPQHRNQSLRARLSVFPHHAFPTTLRAQDKLDSI